MRQAINAEEAELGFEINKKNREIAPFYLQKSKLYRWYCLILAEIEQAEKILARCKVINNNSSTLYKNVPWLKSVFNV